MALFFTRGYSQAAKNKIIILYLSAFLASISTALVSYMWSSFLSEHIGTKNVGLVFMVAYIVSLIVINRFAGIIQKFGTFKISLIALVINLSSLCGLIFSQWIVLDIILIGLYLISTILFFITLDIFLEFFSRDKATGRIRGSFLVTMNLGWVVAPIFAGKILSEFGFDKLFIVSGLTAFVVMLLLIFGLNNLVQRKQKIVEQKFSFWKTWNRIMQNESLRKIFSVAFLLSFFYGFMVIYLPIFLSQNMGFSWTQIGLMFTIMLMPFVIFQYPAGWLADKFLGEKEIMTTGLLILGLSAFLVFWAPSFSMIFWIAVLFLSRTGAAFVESMRDSYFFKQINFADINLINFFRATGPFGYIIAPLIGSVMLYYLPMKFLFLALGIIMILGIYYSLTLKDTK